MELHTSRKTLVHHRHPSYRERCFNSSPLLLNQEMRPNNSEFKWQVQNSLYTICNGAITPAVLFCSSSCGKALSNGSLMKKLIPPVYCFTNQFSNKTTAIYEPHDIETSQTTKPLVHHRHPSDKNTVVRLFSPTSGSRIQAEHFSNRKWQVQTSP